MGSGPMTFADLAAAFPEMLLAVGALVLLLLGVFTRADNLVRIA